MELWKVRDILHDKGIYWKVLLKWFINRMWGWGVYFTDWDYSLSRNESSEICNFLITTATISLSQEILIYRVIKHSIFEYLTGLSGKQNGECYVKYNQNGTNWIFTSNFNFKHNYIVWDIVLIFVTHSIMDLDRPLGLQEVEAPRFQNSWQNEGAKFLSDLRTDSLYTPRDDPGIHFC